jgi:hypothetical protein
MIRVCYIDESGCTGTLPNSTSPIQPVLVIVGIAIHQPTLSHLTHEFIALKRRFFPGLFPNTIPPLSHVRIEVKGADVRTNIRLGARNSRRHSIGYLSNFVGLLEKYNAKIFGRVWIKGIGAKVKGRAIYDFSIQDICRNFQNLLTTEDNYGFIVADSRTPFQNSSVSHSIFTQKFKSAGDSYSRVLEMPTFGHSENHVGLQLTDLLCSSLLCPIAIETYCKGHISSVHIHPRYADIKAKFADRLKALQYRYTEIGKMKGGITVNDQLAHKGSALMFQ